VTVLTELEVEIQQCRLRHVVEAPTLWPLHAHCNRQGDTYTFRFPLLLSLSLSPSPQAARSRTVLSINLPRGDRRAHLDYGGVLLIH